MLNSLLLFFYYNLIIFSIIGYGFLANKILFKSDNFALIGFIGLSFLAFLGLTTSLIFKHNFINNIIILILGLINLFYFSYKSKEKKKYLLLLFGLSLIFFLIIITPGTHSDFDYYHLPFIRYLTEHKIIFGLGHANHSYNFISLFYLNSLFVLPYIEYFAINIISISFLIFFNFHLLLNIFEKKKLNYYIKFFSLLSLFFFNYIFNSIHSFGTDFAGQLLIIIAYVYLLETIYND